jgi:hypothetical protein
MIELQFTPDGKVRSIYKDENLPIFSKLGTVQVSRASNVEWEDGGWTVRAAHDPELAIRGTPTNDGKFKLGVSKTGLILHFETRESALKTEVEFFWALLPPNQEHE